MLNKGLPENFHPEGSEIEIVAEIAVQASPFEYHLIEY